MITWTILLILILILIRECEETERRTNEDMEEKRREISELSSDLAASRSVFSSPSHWVEGQVEHRISL